MVTPPKAPQRFPRVCTGCEWCEAMWILMEALRSMVAVERDRDKSSTWGGGVQEKLKQFCFERYIQIRFQ